MKALRTAKLVIDIPVPGAEPFIMGILQHVEVSPTDEVLSVSFRQHEMHRKSSDILMDMCTFTDPVTQHECTISGAGLQVAITKMVSQWIIEDMQEDGHTAYVNEFDRVIVEGM